MMINTHPGTDRASEVEDIMDLAVEFAASYAALDASGLSDAFLAPFERNRDALTNAITALAAECERMRGDIGRAIESIEASTEVWDGVVWDGDGEGESLAERSAQHAGIAIDLLCDLLTPGPPDATSEEGTE